MPGSINLAKNSVGEIIGPTSVLLNGHGVNLSSKYAYTDKSVLLSAVVRSCYMQ